MPRLSPSEEAQKAKDQHTLDQATQRFLGLRKTRRTTYARRPGVPDEIDEATLLQVKTRWNTYAPISRIPNETLLEIFMIIKEDEEFSFTDFHRIAQICGRWRVVAISTPGLWTDLPTGLHEYTLLMLERSKSAPLTVELQKKILTVTMHAVLTHMDRIRKLDLYLPPSGLIDVQEFLIKEGRQALCLEEVIVKEAYVSVFDRTRFTFCLDAFRPTNRLRCLKLASGLRHDWDILTCHSLTHLILSNVYSKRRVSLMRFVEGLRLMKDLQTLEMHADGINFNGETTERSLFIKHPKLSSLVIHTIGATQEDLSYFLAHTAFPSLKYLHVENIGHRKKDSSSLLLAISHNLEHGQFRNPYALDLGFYGVRLYCRLDPNHPPHARPQLELATRYDSDLRGVDSDYAFIRDVLDWTVRLNDGISSSLVAVTAGTSLRLSASEFGLLFGQLPKVEEIEVYNNTISSLIEALIVDSEGMQSPLFPSLRKIHWWKEPVYTYIPDTLEPTIFNDFARSLKIRQRNNLALHALHLHGAFEQDQIDLLADSVLEINISER